MFLQYSTVTLPTTPSGASHNWGEFIFTNDKMADFFQCINGFQSQPDGVSAIRSQYAYLNALGQNSVAAVVDHNIHQAGEREEEVDGGVADVGDILGLADLALMLKSLVLYGNGILIVKADFEL